MKGCLQAQSLSNTTRLSSASNLCFSEGICLGIEAKLAQLIGSFSFGLRLFSSASCKKASAELHMAGVPGEDGERYLSGSAVLSIFFSFLFFALLFSIGLGLAESFAAAMLSFAAFFLFLLFLPRMLSSRRQLLIEAELPFLLREFAVYLDIGMPFEKCMEEISKKEYLLSSSFKAALGQIRSGSTIPQALIRVSSESKSIQLKRSMLILSEIYEVGAGSEQLKHFADSLSDMQSSNIRAQAGKLAFLSVLFISASAILPAFFCIFFVVLPFFGEPISEGYSWLFFLFIFPILDAAILLAMVFNMPAPDSALAGKQALEDYLSRRGFSYGAKGFALSLAFASLGLSLLFLAFGQAWLAALALCAGPSAYALASHYASKEHDSAEDFLPEALHSAASVQKVLSPEKMLSFLAKSGYGRLSEAFETALRRQKAGESFSLSMRHALSSCQTFLVRRAFGLLIVSYETGADMRKALRETASDAAAFFSIIKERAAALAVQHYTLLAASSFLVPFILGSALSMVPAISSSASIGGLSENPAQFSSLALACQLYLAACSFFSSFALSISSGKRESWLLYFSLILPLSQCVFLLSSGSLGGMQALAS
ncbi:MAG: type II secretion system F family protein [Candidatus Micrarchaeota archaeon]|nr:type II secretion system F family protein [Candidatus Micrarchaeota archaeon]